MAVAEGPVRRRFEGDLNIVRRAPKCTVQRHPPDITEVTTRRQFAQRFRGRKRPGARDEVAHEKFTRGGICAVQAGEALVDGARAFVGAQLGVGAEPTVLLDAGDMLHVIGDNRIKIEMAGVGSITKYRVTVSLNVVD